MSRQADTDPSATNGATTSLAPEPSHTEAVAGTTDDDSDPEAQESTPLLLHRTISDSEHSVAASRPRRSWWTIVSIVLLLAITVNIIVFAFVIPSATQNYAAQATTYQLQDIQIQNFTDEGLISKAVVNVTLDASRVKRPSIRRIGLFGTNLFKHVYTKECNVSLFLPQYSSAQVAYAILPPLTIDIRNKHHNILHVITNTTITNEPVAIQLVGDILSGKRSEIKAIGETDVDIKAGIIPLGKHHIVQQVIVKGRYHNTSLYLV
jgi:hypothetical protein